MELNADQALLDVIQLNIAMELLLLVPQMTIQHVQSVKITAIIMEFVFRDLSATVPLDTLDPLVTSQFAMSTVTVEAAQLMMVADGAVTHHVVSKVMHNLLVYVLEHMPIITAHVVMDVIVELALVVNASVTSVMELLTAVSLLTVLALYYIQVSLEK